MCCGAWRSPTALRRGGEGRGPYGDGAALETELRGAATLGLVTGAGGAERCIEGFFLNANSGLRGVLKSNEYGVFRYQTAGGVSPRVPELVTRAVTGERAGRICRFWVVPGGREPAPLRAEALVPGSTHVLSSLWRGRRSEPAVCFQNRSRGILLVRH